MHCTATTSKSRAASTAFKRSKSRRLASDGHHGGGRIRHCAAARRISPLREATLRRARDEQWRGSMMGLAGAVHLTDRHGLNLNHFEAVLSAGPMASDDSREKAPKLVAHDFAPRRQQSQGRVVNHATPFREAEERP